MGEFIKQLFFIKENKHPVSLGVKKFRENKNRWSFLCEYVSVDGTKLININEKEPKCQLRVTSGSSN
jgi:hypothetical protein